MELGTSIPQIGPLASPELMLAWAKAADAAGFDGLWTADHLVVPRVMESNYTLRAKPFPMTFEQLRQMMGVALELNATLAAAAAVTERARLYTGVAVLPIRNPLANAHQLATIDLISGGRLTYGVGVGWLKEEADALGMPWDRRGARTDDMIALMRTLWTAEGETIEYHGEFYDVPEIDVNPLPVQRPIPIYVGGHSDVALDRVARLADGWIAAGLGQARYPEAYERLQRAFDKHGRDLGELAIVNGEHTDVLLDAGAPDLSAQVERVLENLAAYEALGVTHMKVSVGATSPAGALEMVDAFGREVLPAYRSR
ncbi:MAG TPA: TIGR03619 family F420-dependent LLM class oxidoreductase [Acidimicrobiales bacterium]